MVVFKHHGDLSKTEKFLKNAANTHIYDILKRYGEKGVKALQAATPVDTGKTAASWSYSVEVTKSYVAIHWVNSNRVNGVPIALILQLGHATRNGGYVQGRDYINPAMKPIFEEIEEAVWREVTKL